MEELHPAGKTTLSCQAGKDEELCDLLKLIRIGLQSLCQEILFHKTQTIFSTAAHTGITFDFNLSSCNICEFESLCSDSGR